MASLARKPKQREAFLALVLQEGKPVTPSALAVGVSRNTGKLWLRKELVKRGETGGAKCAHPPCQKQKTNGRWCAAHYHRQKRGQQMDGPARYVRVSAADQFCSVAGCGGAHGAKGLCLAHHQRKRLGDPDWARPVKRRNGQRRGWQSYAVPLPARTWRKLGRIGAARGMTAQDVLAEAADVVAQLVTGRQLERVLGEAFAWAQRIPAEDLA